MSNIITSNISTEYAVKQYKCICIERKLYIFRDIIINLFQKMHLQKKTDIKYLREILANLLISNV